MLKLTHENYHSLEADRQYMSVSLLKSFLPQYGGCEAKAMAKLRGEYKEPSNDAFLLGSYVHAWNEGANLGQFQSEHPEMFKKNGEMLQKFEIGNRMIKTLADDELVSQVRKGQKEVIMTVNNLFGAPWKAMIDIYNPEMKSFADLKTTREIHMKYWNEEDRCKKNFIETYGYDIQMAVYAEIIRLNTEMTDYMFPHIIAVSKEDPPDKAVIKMGTNFINETLLMVQDWMERVADVWQGKAEPQRCEICDFCRSTKKLDKIIFYTDI